MTPERAKQVLVIAVVIVGTYLLWWRDVEMRKPGSTYDVVYVWRGLLGYCTKTYIEYPSGAVHAARTGNVSHTINWVRLGATIMLQAAFPGLAYWLWPQPDWGTGRRCPECGYSLQVANTTHCPECGVYTGWRVTSNDT